MLLDTLVTLAFALMIDAAIGYPSTIYERIGHPVAWIGSLITALEKRYDLEGAAPEKVQKWGMWLLAATIGICVGVALIIVALTRLMPPSFVWQGLIASTLIASHSLYEHVEAVSYALENQGVDEGREALAQMVDDDVSKLDRFQVARTAIESLAENASDGVIAPAFWLLMGGLPGLVAYKAINTTYSMLRQKSPRSADFGHAAGRLNELVNWPAARMTAGLYILAAFMTKGASGWSAFQTMKRNAVKYRLPNQNWPKSAVAGALGLKLAGPRVYDGIVVEEAYIGPGRTDATFRDIDRALSLCVRAWGLLAAGVIAWALISLF